MDERDLGPTGFQYGHVPARTSRFVPPGKLSVHLLAPPPRGCPSMRRACRTACPSRCLCALGGSPAPPSATLSSAASRCCGLTCWTPVSVRSRCSWSSSSLSPAGAPTSSSPDSTHTGQHPHSAAVSPRRYGGSHRPPALKHWISLRQPRGVPPPLLRCPCERARGDGATAAVCG